MELFEAEVGNYTMLNRQFSTFDCKEIKDFDLLVSHKWEKSEDDKIKAKWI